jgi:hypothetical protein
MSRPQQSRLVSHRTKRSTIARCAPCHPTRRRRMLIMVDLQASFVLPTPAHNVATYYTPYPYSAAPYGWYPAFGGYAPHYPPTQQSLHPTQTSQWALPAGPGPTQSAQPTSHTEPQRITQPEEIATIHEFIRSQAESGDDNRSTLMFSGVPTRWTADIPFIAISRLSGGEIDYFQMPKDDGTGE